MSERYMRLPRMFGKSSDDPDYLSVWYCARSDFRMSVSLSWWLG